MDFQCKVIQYIGETTGTSKAGNPWKKKEWVVETFGQYPRKVKIQCFGDRSDTINLEVGKDYNIFVDLESREFNGRWYTDVSVYRVEPFVNSQPGAMNPPMSQGGFSQPSQNINAPYGTPGGFGGQAFTATTVEESEEDLPF